MSRFEIGMHKQYIKDYPGFRHLVDIPVEAALAWIKKIFPDKCLLMGSRTSVKDLTLENFDETWVSRAWMIVNCEHDKWIALSNKDGTFSIYVKPVGRPEDFEQDEKDPISDMVMKGPDRVHQE